MCVLNVCIPLLLSSHTPCVYIIIHTSFAWTSLFTHPLCTSLFTPFAWTSLFTPFVWTSLFTHPLRGRLYSHPLRGCVRVCDCSNANTRALRHAVAVCWVSGVVLFPHVSELIQYASRISTAPSQLQHPLIIPLTILIISITHHSRYFLFFLFKAPPSSLSYIYRTSHIAPITFAPLFSPLCLYICTSSNKHLTQIPPI